MTRHCVLFAFKKDCPEAKLSEAEGRFAALRELVPGVEALEWGRNSSPEGLAKGYTHCFFLTFADDAARDRYLVHPNHRAFVDFVGPLIDEALVVDYRP